MRRLADPRAGQWDGAICPSLSSAHINFYAIRCTIADEGWLLRHSIQFHWHNASYHCFDDFLASPSSRKRKNIRKERQSLVAAGVTMRQLTGDAISPDHIDAFYRFYLSTIDRKWGGAYLTLPVFQQLRKSMADKMLLVVAEYHGRIIGGALNFIGEDTLYGRNWGAILISPFCILRLVTIRQSITRSVMVSPCRGWRSRLSQGPARLSSRNHLVAASSCPFWLQTAVARFSGCRVARDRRREKPDRYDDPIPGNTR